MTYPNWFKSHASNFENQLVKYKNASNLKFLQIGVYTGDASVWLLENILTNSTSILFDVDTWQGSDEEIHKSFDWQDIEKAYDEKVAKYKNVKKQKVQSKDFLIKCKEAEFDFIYIDGDHEANSVYLDALLSFKALKVAGIMAFDDYEWTHDSKDPLLAPKNGIEKFIAEYQDRIIVKVKNYQVWIQKKF